MPTRTDTASDPSKNRPLPSVILETTVSANYTASFPQEEPVTVHRLVDTFNSCFLTSHNRVIPVRIVAEMSSTISSRAHSSSSSLHNEQHNNMRNNRNASIAETPPPSPSSGSTRASKHCCFCWCCCCSCSCLTVRNGKNNVAQDSKLDNMSEKEEAPSLEDIKSWSDSFDKLMKSPAGRKIFREFLRGEYSEENMLFWLACEDLRNMDNGELVEEKARLIYEDYISILSPKEVSLDSRVRELINRNMVEPSKSTFDEAQLQIYTLMHRDSYPRFLNSQIYKRLVQTTCA